MQLALPIDELPVIDVVFVSHNHYDHLDADTIRAFSARFPGAVYVVPLGSKPWLVDHGVARRKFANSTGGTASGCADSTSPGASAQHWNNEH